MNKLFSFWRDNDFYTLFFIKNSFIHSIMFDIRLTILLLLSCICGCDAVPHMLLVGRAALATGWIPAVGSIIAIVLLRISPDVFAIYYNNDGISQLINVIMGVDFIDEMLTDIQISLYPAILNDMQQSRHDKKGCMALAQCLCALASPNLRNNPVLIIMRDAQRFPNDDPFFKRFSKVANKLHSNVHIAFEREGLLSDAVLVKEFVVQNSNARYSLSNIASHVDTTHTLTQNDDEEEMQEVVAECACGLAENFSVELLISLNDSVESGNKLPSDEAIEPLRDLLIECCKQVSAGTLSGEDAAKRFNTCVNSDEYSDLFPPQLLELQNAIATRRSRCSNSSSLLDHVDTSSFVETIASTTKLLPDKQTRHVLAALLTRDDNSATNNDLCAIAVHMEQMDRNFHFKHSLVKLLALGARADSKMDTMAASTLTRLLTKSNEGRVVLSILKSNDISLILAYHMGFDPQSQANKMHWRQMNIALLRSELAENLEDLSDETTSKVLTTCSIVDEGHKKAVTDQLQSFNTSLTSLSWKHAKRYNVGKQLEISTKSIKSLAALPAITNQGDRSLQTVKSVAQIPVFDILTQSLASLAIEKHDKNEEGPGGKYSSLDEMNASSKSMDLDDDDGIEDFHCAMPNQDMSNDINIDESSETMVDDAPSSSSVQTCRRKPGIRKKRKASISNDDVNDAFLKKPESINESSHKWSCPKCTLMNDVSSSQCDVCGGLRPRECKKRSSYSE